MTANQLFEAALTELNKVNAPSLILEDYNYFINKAITQYINKQYNAYDMNQQKTDDLRVLKSTAVLTPKKQMVYPELTGSPVASTSPLFKTTYEVDLPDDYLHLLNAVIEYKVNQKFKCYDNGTFVHFGLKRMTADMFGQIINNYYLRPRYDSPYYYINNVNVSNLFPTQDDQSSLTLPDYNVTTGGSTEFRTYLNMLVQSNGELISNVPKGIYELNNAHNMIEVKIEKSPKLINFSNCNFDFIYDSNYTEGAYGTITSTTPYYFSSLGLKANDILIFSTAEDLPNNINKSVDVVFSIHEIRNTLSGIETIIIDSARSGYSSTSVVHALYQPTFQLLGSHYNLNGAQRDANLRYGNSSKVRMELRFGKDDKVFTPNAIYVDYLRAPQFIRLTQEQVDAVEDNSQILEFPDYVCQEIVNELVHILMENASDPRMQSHIPISQSIAPPNGGQQK